MPFHERVMPEQLAFLFEGRCLIRRLFVTLALSAVTAFAYVASPLWTAWSIREAVKAGDQAYLEQKIDWPQVRQTLSHSLLQGAAQEAVAARGDETAPSRSGLLQSIKTWVGRSMVDRFVATNVTPEGLPRLFGIGKTYRAYVHGERDAERTLATLPKRVAKFWARIKRAEFLSLTSFEIDFLDKYNPERMYVGRLQLTAKGWRLVALRIASVAALPKPARAL